MKKLGLFLLIAVLASVLPGCGPYAITNMSGRGSVEISDVMFDKGAGVVKGETGLATFSLSFACYAQNNNRLQAQITWNDPTNGVKISATQPEVSIKTLTNGEIATCKALKAGAAEAYFYAAASGIYSESGNANGDMGTRTGYVFIGVSKPGVPTEFNCEATESSIVIMAETTKVRYEAGGCLDRGAIVFGSGGQNGQ